MRVSSKNKPPRKREQKPGSLVLQGEGEGRQGAQANEVSRSVASDNRSRPAIVLAISSWTANTSSMTLSYRSDQS
jgi:hypothetical protein